MHFSVIKFDTSHALIVCYRSSEEQHLYTGNTDPNDKAVTIQNPGLSNTGLHDEAAANQGPDLLNTDQQDFIMHQISLKLILLTLDTWL